MEQEHKKQSTFVDFLSYEQLRPEAEQSHSSIIKPTSIKSAERVTMEFLDGVSSEPSILIHRQGDRVERIEFVCPCGKSSHVKLEYDEE